MDFNKIARQIKREEDRLYWAIGTSQTTGCIREDDGFDELCEAEGHIEYMKKYTDCNWKIVYKGKEIK